jgi:hypothetical protein
VGYSAETLNKKPHDGTEFKYRCRGCAERVVKLRFFLPDRARQGFSDAEAYRKHPQDPLSMSYMAGWNHYPWAHGANPCKKAR